MTQKGSEGGQNTPPPHITDLGPHSRYVVTPSGDVNNTTDVRFQLFSGGVNCWNAVVPTSLQAKPGVPIFRALPTKLVKDRFDCEFRGRVSAKHKGEIDIYFVNGFRREPDRFR